MSRRPRRRPGDRTRTMGKRQASSLRNLGMGVVALVALLALGGQLSSSAAGCFSAITDTAGEPLEVGGATPPDTRMDEPPAGTARVRIQTETKPAATDRTD
jgi:hypothetical protein